MARRLPPGWRDVVVVCAANPWTGIKLADQQMAERLADSVPVVYVDPPQSPLTRFRNPAYVTALTRAPVRVGENLIRVTPVVTPRPARPGVAGLTARLLRRVLRGLAAEVPVDAVVSAWPLYPVFGSARERVSVFWAQDDFSSAAEAWGYSPARVAAAEAARVGEADLVVAASPLTFDRWKDASRAIELIPYGADVTPFGSFDDVAPAADVHLDPPVAVVVGQLNFRTDLAMLEAVVEDGMSLLIVGPVTHPDTARVARLLARPTVQAVGLRPIADIPGYLRRADVGLVPYDHCAFNQASFPLKTLEYLAGRLPVVSTDLPATRWLGTDLVSIADDPASFAAAARAAAGTAGDPSLRADRWRFAKAHSYARRAEALLASIERHQRAPR